MAPLNGYNPSNAVRQVTHTANVLAQAPVNNKYEALVATLLPRWFLRAPESLRNVLKESMSRLHESQKITSQIVANVQPIEQFCEPLLKMALAAYGWGRLDVKSNALKQVHLVNNLLIFIARQHIKLVDSAARTLLPESMIPESLELNLVASTSHLNLLQAAMQNFEHSETAVGGFDAGSCIYSLGPDKAEVPNSTLTPEKFAQICRDLNLGLQYQLHLDRQLTPVENEWPNSDPRSRAFQIKEAFTENIRYEFACALHLAFMKGYLSPDAYRFMDDLLVAQPSVFTTGAASCATFQILEFEVTGVMVFLPKRKARTHVQPCVVYLPQAPGRCFYEFETFAAFQAHLREWLKNPRFADYFVQRVPLRHRAEFIRRTHIKHARWDSLLLRRPPIIYEPALFTLSQYNPKAENPFEVAWLQQLAQIKDDASLLVVSTEDEDKQTRLERQAMYLNLGMSLLGLALGFVPIVGQVLLAVSVIELGEEVYKGIQAWENDDRMSAVNYLFDVAQNVALQAGTWGAVKALTPAAHVEAMIPVKVEQGVSKLWKPDITGYEFKHTSLQGMTPDQGGIYKKDGQLFITLDDQVYGVGTDTQTRTYYLKHPTDAGAYKVKLSHNNTGIWTHELDKPLHWERAQLLKRMGPDAQALSAQTLDKVMTLSGLSDAQLRHVVLEHLPTPALWVDGIKRATLIEKIETFVARMKNGNSRFDADADLQLRLLTQLPGWPTDRVLRVVENNGVLFREYGNDLVSRIPRLQVTEAQIAHRDLLKVTLDCLSQNQITQLLGREVVAEQEQVEVLAQTLGAYAQTTQQSLLLSLYTETEQVSAIGTLIKKQFPSLPATVIEELVGHLSAEHLGLIQRSNHLPLVVLEEARHYVQSVRISRAIEGLLFESHVTEDSLKIASHISALMPGWPPALRVIVRHKITDQELASFGRGSSPHVRTREIFKNGNVYEYFGFGRPQSFTNTSLLKCLYHTLSETERSALRLPSDTYEAFVANLATIAVQQRSQSAKALGMHTIKPWIKSPLRLADGRLGYPLGGRAGRLLPESSPLILKDQLIELYPLMTDAEAGHFLVRLKMNAAQLARALVGLKAELDNLRTELDAWVASDVWCTPADRPRFKLSIQVKKSMRRAVIRAWRRQSPSSRIAGFQGYELDLDAWPVDTLPELSADFPHIHTLNLSHSTTSRLSEAFLKKFKQLRVLMLRNNAFSELPPTVGEMTELRTLNLQGNRILLTAATQETLTKLTKLQSLNLTGNTLGRRLSVGQLAELEHLHMRYTGIEQWPEGLERLTRLQVVDLRDNAISHVPPEVLSPERNAINNVTFLHDNPLDTDSLRRLYLYRQEQGINFGIWVSRQHVTTHGGILHWASIPSAEQTAVWNALRAEDNAEDFFRVLEDLSESAQFIHNYEDLSGRVWTLINAMHESYGLRVRLFEISSHPRTCVDGIAMVFADLELRFQIYNAENGLNTEEQLMELTRGLFRMETLNAHVDTVIAQRIAHISAQPVSAVQRLQRLIDAVSPNFAESPLSEMSAQECQGIAYRLGTPEALELAEILSPRWLRNHLALIDQLQVQMYYQVHLAQALGLPSRPHSMIFENVARVTPAELEAGKRYVIDQETPDALKASLIARDYWQNFLRFKYPDAFIRSDEVQDERMGALFAARESMSDHDYMAQVEAVVTEREHARLELVTRLTEEEITENPQFKVVLQPAPE